MEPYLHGESRRLFDAWHEGLRRRYERDLTFPEIRKGVQALSSLYVGGRGKLAQGGGEAFEGTGKRAAFALYYAPLHFITTWHVAREIGFDSMPFPRLWDLGCGTGAAGAGWATAARFVERETVGAAPPKSDDSGHPRALAHGSPGDRPGAERAHKIVGVDRSGFALDEAAATYRAFGLKGETKRLVLGEAGGDTGPMIAIRTASPAAPRRRREKTGLRPDDALLLGWTLNEMADAPRERLLHEVAAASGSGRPVLILEPIAKRVAPWWSRWERALGEDALSLHAFEWRRRLELPAWIAEMDSAAGLDHRELTARVLAALG